MLRRARFGDLIRRQLDVFELDAASLLQEATDADAAWTRAGRDDAEELYGDYQLVVDELADRLLDTRESYARALDESTAATYRAEFTSAARKRFRPYATLLEDE